jgi:hypothetical protein
VKKQKQFVAVSALLLLIAVSFQSQTVLAQTQKLGIVKYTAPKGWNKTTKENVVAFSDFNQATGNFCIITLYGATPGTGNPESDFKREWNNLVVKPLGADANPETESETAPGWTTIAGGSAINFQGGQALAFLTVISRGATTVSILSVFNDKSYTTQLAAFSSSLDLEKAVTEVRPRQNEESLRPSLADNVAEMHASELVREFETNEVRANQVWIGRRVRIHGIVNTIEIGKDGRIVLTFKSSISTYNNARCFFSPSQSSRVATLSAHTEATVEGTVRGLGGGFDNSKAFVLLENCIVP